MQIVYHIGANCTDQDQLLKSMLKNSDSFASQRIKVPGPGKYRSLVRETIQRLNGSPPSEGARDILLDAIIDNEDCNRLILSNDQFICVHGRAFENAVFFEQTEFKLNGLRSLFPEDDIEIFLGLRNPATLIPALFNESKKPNFNAFMAGTDPMQIRWSSLIARIHNTLPNARLTVWCNEDTPYIWAQLIRELAGVDRLTPIKGGFDLLSTIMSQDGMKQFVTELKTAPPQTERQKRLIIASHLERYALPEKVEEEIDLPGWTHETVDQLTANYETDLKLIAPMEGVKFIAP